MCGARTVGLSKAVLDTPWSGADSVRQSPWSPCFVARNPSGQARRSASPRGLGFVRRLELGTCARLRASAVLSRDRPAEKGAQFAHHTPVHAESYRAAQNSLLMGVVRVIYVVNPSTRSSARKKFRHTATTPRWSGGDGAWRGVSGGSARSLGSRRRHRIRPGPRRARSSTRLVADRASGDAHLLTGPGRGTHRSFGARAPRPAVSSARGRPSRRSRGSRRPALS